MINIETIDENILVLKYSGILTLADLHNLDRETEDPALKILMNEKAIGIVNDLRECEDMTPDAKSFYLDTIQKYKDPKRYILAILFDDRHNPIIRMLQEVRIADKSIFANYFTSFDRAIEFIKERIKTLEN